MKESNICDKDVNTKKQTNTTCPKTKICAVITGSTGFLGEVLVKHILDTYIDIKLYLIIRDKKNLSATQRAKLLFDDNQNISVINGDLDTLNINKILINIDKNDKITHIIHGAANVKFTEAHSVIAKTNISSSLKMKKIAIKCNAKFVYISTAFVTSKTNHSTNYLTNAKVILPKNDLSAKQLYHMMKIDGEEEKKEINQYMNRYNIANNYILSKIITENLIMTSNNSIIIRPSIITHSYYFPYYGWLGRSVSPVTRMTAGIASKLIRCVVRAPLPLIRKQQSMPIIPVDFVTKCIIDNINDDHNIDNEIYLAALNTNITNTKSKLCSFYDAAYYGILSIPTLSKLEIILIRLLLILSSLSQFIFTICYYFMNEIFCPDKYRKMVEAFYHYQHFTYTNFEITSGQTTNDDFDATHYVKTMFFSGYKYLEKYKKRKQIHIAKTKMLTNLEIIVLNEYTKRVS